MRFFCCCICLVCLVVWLIGWLVNWFVSFNWGEVGPFICFVGSFVLLFQVVSGFFFVSLVCSILFHKLLTFCYTLWFECFISSLCNLNIMLQCYWTTWSKKRITCGITEVSRILIFLFHLVSVHYVIGTYLGFCKLHSQIYPSKRWLFSMSFWYIILSRFDSKGRAYQLSVPWDCFYKEWKKHMWVTLYDISKGAVPS